MSVAFRVRGHEWEPECVEEGVHSTLSDLAAYATISYGCNTGKKPRNLKPLATITFMV